MPNRSVCPRPPALVALVGPTAVGKSDFALRLAARFPLEIVNADSRQVYVHMDIGTSKPTPAELARAPHHVFDIVDPDQDFSLSDYLRHARAAVGDVISRGRIPLVVGGSGQYVWSLLEGWQVPEVPPDNEFRREMEQRAVSCGPVSLHEELARIDADAAYRIRPTNVRRVIRALELHHATGELPSVLLRRRSDASFRTLVIGLSLDRTLLFARVDARIDTMMNLGFPDEVRKLLGMGYGPSLPAMSSIGYREMVAFVTGAIDVATAVSRVRHETRRLVRRQHAWFRPSDERIQWLDVTEPGTALARAMEAIEGAMT